ncbi:MAG: hypothetical protein R2873_02175 [Caldilineaceae bacterium]
MRRADRRHRALSTAWNDELLGGLVGGGDRRRRRYGVIGRINIARWVRHTAATAEATKLVAIPYYAWANAGEQDARVGGADGVRVVSRG